VPSDDYNERLVQRISARLAGRDDVEAMAKMGGTTFMVDGKVCVRAHQGELMARCRPALTDALLARPGVRRFEMKGRANMKGWLLVDRSATEADADLAFWIDGALEAVSAAESKARKK
jgi:hypothetical protein